MDKGPEGLRKDKLSTFYLVLGASPVLGWSRLIPLGEGGLETNCTPPTQEVETER